MIAVFPVFGPGRRPIANQGALYPGGSFSQSQQ
jgi:hypothetical protein